jgi:FdhD protein
MGRVTQRRKVHRYVLDGSAAALEFPVRHREDVLAVEEPLEIRLGNLSFSVTMRTPGTTSTSWQVSSSPRASSGTPIS